VKYKYPDSNLKLNLQFQEFPVKSSESILGFMLQLMFPLYFCMSAITLSSPFVIGMISEKKAKLKSALQMMVRTELSCFFFVIFVYMFFSLFC